MSIYTKNNDETFILEFEEIKNDLTLALQIAYSNYCQEKKGFWSKIFGGKKELNIVAVKK